MAALAASVCVPLRASAHRRQCRVAGPNYRPDGAGVFPFYGAQRSDRASCAALGLGVDHMAEPSIMMVAAQSSQS